MNENTSMGHKYSPLCDVTVYSSEFPDFFYFILFLFIFFIYFLFFCGGGGGVFTPDKGGNRKRS